MKDIFLKNCTELTKDQLKQVQGGGPIIDAVEWYYKTVGSFYRGIWDGLTGVDPVI